MADNLIENLYEKSLLIKDDNGNEIELQPHPIPKFSCVQYCRRLPNNLSCSVHYEVYTSKEKDEIKGYWVALHTEGETAGGNKQIRKKLVNFLKQGLHLNGKIQISNNLGGTTTIRLLCISA